MKNFKKSNVFIELVCRHKRQSIRSQTRRMPALIKPEVDIVETNAGIRSQTRRMPALIKSKVHIDEQMPHQNPREGLCILLNTTPPAKSCRKCVLTNKCRHQIYPALKHIILVSICIFIFFLSHFLRISILVTIF